MPENPEGGRTFRISIWPGWNMSKAPSMYTMLALGGAGMPSENCTIRREVGINLDRVTCVDAGSRLLALPSAARASPSSSLGT